MIKETILKKTEFKFKNKVPKILIKSE